MLHTPQHRMLRMNRYDRPLQSRGNSPPISNDPNTVFRKNGVSLNSDMMKEVGCEGGRTCD